MTGGRRRGPSKGDLREQAILRVAAAMVAEQPIAQITIDSLAAAAGISRSSFYFYFGSKAEVLARLLAPVAAELSQAMVSWSEGGGPDPEPLRAALRRSVGVWREHRDLLRQVLLDAAPDPVIAPLRARMIGDCIDLTAARIRRERAAGRAPAGPPPAETLARALNQLTFAVLATSPLGVPGDEAEAAVVELLETVVQRVVYAATPVWPPTALT
ncbi:TetR/AcrR family transcriptional regulator [Kitasatospora sp. Root107]|uniref:TetR/AcrR family transcriptional regulator n=1 Tax=Kitasatospora sp. Root107 TaxID=1736424 RepID=UPI0007C6D11A|nr:TetR/AcrR family transcriptional regulator [Kitasatospora sp. Root107]